MDLKQALLDHAKVKAEFLLKLISHSVDRLSLTEEEKQSLYLNDYTFRQVLDREFELYQDLLDVIKDPQEQEQVYNY